MQNVPHQEEVEEDDDDDDEESAEEANKIEVEKCVHYSNSLSQFSTYKAVHHVVHVYVYGWMDGYAYAFRLFCMNRNSRCMYKHFPIVNVFVYEFLAGWKNGIIHTVQCSEFNCMF